MTFTGPVHVLLQAVATKPVVKEIIGNLMFLEVPVADVRDNLRSTLNCGINNRFNVISDASPLDNCRFKYCCMVMNEAGIATNSVTMNLVKRNRRTGKFRFEFRNTPRCGSVMFVRHRYVPLRRRIRPAADTDDSDDSLRSVLSVNHGVAQPAVTAAAVVATAQVIGAVVPQQNAAVDAVILSEITNRVKVTKGGRTTNWCVRDKHGHILKTAGTPAELFMWVYHQFGAHFHTRVSCF